MMMDTSDAGLAALSERVGRKLRGAGCQMVLAESCTGGWIAKVITDVAGSSEWFDRGFVTYSNTAKQDELAVREETLAIHGAVSGEVAMEMARGAIARSQADLAVAVTGVAGPGGGSPDKPVGTVWFAWAGRNIGEAECRHFAGDREQIRRQTVAHALQGMLLQLNEFKW